MAGGVLTALQIQAIDLGTDAADGLTAAPGQEELRLGMLEKRVLARRQRLAPLEAQRLHEARMALAVKAARQADEFVEIAPRGHGPNLDRVGTAAPAVSGSGHERAFSSRWKPRGS